MSRDLLSGLLPSGDPFAPFDADAYRSTLVAKVPPKADALEEPKPPVAASVAEPPIAPAITVDTEPVVQSVAVAEPEMPEPEVVAQTSEIATEVPTGIPVLEAPSTGPRIPTTKTKRRKKKSLAGPLMAVFALLMFAGIAGCLYLLVTGRGLSTDGRLIATGPKSGEAAPPNNAIDPVAEERPAFDPIMGNMQPSGQIPAADSGLDKPMQEPAMGKPANDMTEQGTEMPAMDEPDLGQPMMSDSNMSDSDTSDSDMVNPDMSDLTTSEPQPDVPVVEEMPAEPMVEAQPAMEPDSMAEMQGVEAADEALEGVKKVLRSGRLNGMASAVEKADEAMVTPEQKQELASYKLLVELAEYYFEGVRRGSAKLGVGESFDLRPGFTVGVVEGTRDKIALKINGKVKSYPMDEISLVLADRLSKFGLPEDNAEVVAGRAAYQALWSQATAAHREQAVDWLNEIPADSARFDAKALVTAINKLFE